MWNLASKRSPTRTQRAELRPAGRRPMGVKQVFGLLFLLVLATAFWGSPAAVAAGAPVELLQQADRCRKALYSSAKKKKFRHHWLNCIRRYEKIIQKYPHSDQAPWAFYHAARSYRDLHRYSGKRQDFDRALELNRRLAEEFTEHRLADDAQYAIGEIFQDVKQDYAQAYVEFLKVDIKFPSGDMRPRARKKLDKLSVILSKRDRESAGKTGVADDSRLTALEEIRHWSTSNYTRVVLDMAKPVKYEHHLLQADQDRKKPRRLYLDLKNARVSSEADSMIPIKDGLLQGARAGQHSPDEVRVVLDIDSIGGYKVFHLYDPFRIVIDVSRTAGSATAKRKPKVALKKRRPRKGIHKSRTPDSSVSLARQLGLSVQTVVIDPGHGGKDPGCFVRGGIKEKDIVLKIGKLLAKKIEAEIGCEVDLTRTKDVFVSLEQRTAIANMKKADLFISLHINAHRSAGVRGIETYFLNMATDERAVRVAARENATSEKNISDLQAILNDLMLNTKIHESSRLAHEVQEGILSRLSSSYRSVRNLGVKQAPFYVLIGAEMPAVLVETGFLTNPTERKRLLDRSYYNRISDGIIEGIKTYIESIDQVYLGG